MAQVHFGSSFEAKALRLTVVVVWVLK